jgi:hypothetical protein
VEKERADASHRHREEEGKRDQRDSEWVSTSGGLICLIANNLLV